MSHPEPERREGAPPGSSLLAGRTPEQAQADWLHAEVPVDCPGNAGLSFSSSQHTTLYLDTMLNMHRLVKAAWVVVAAVACAVVFGVGVPLFWVWLASQFQPTVGGGGGTGMLPATIVIVGPLASYIVLVVLASRFRFSQPSDWTPEPQRMAWTRSRDEIRRRARYTSTFEQIVLLAVLVVGLGFEVWFFGFANCSSALCG